MGHLQSQPELGVGEVVIDEGLRRWHRACPCCLGEAYPEIRRALDAETQAVPALPRSGGAAVEELDMGGDPACWAHLVCPECGAVGSHRPGCSAALA